ncbi:metalloregulator ArsR/SmtB family transcription factor [Aliidiomarina haloalkalitolerans]|uniref:ArsR family transcriptional regulator n=1 Tax=Aliidiomarina haloalkalitolerans TaxID=859059 RepID=A0A432VS45_9GAMM|nr:metalloregulator ArsR/SmtB family transcription factor [Aliidiomarina haloalkalitolerans]RUO19156.1 ArsR family transcriptional regulator [Aliidiomarina haloalkalitolerans]
MVTKVLFVCTANSARSIMAEALMRQFAGDDVEVASAGTEPGIVAAGAIAALQDFHLDTKSLHSKSLDDLNTADYDYVISLCDRARTECQANFTSQNFIAWDFPDPTQSDSPNAFKQTLHELSERIRMFLLILRKRQTQPHLFNSPADFFKVLADPLRLTMLMHLVATPELCVCDLVERTGMSQPKVSRHLAQLREYGLLLDRKEERWVHYRLNPAMPDWMRNVIQVSATHNPQFIETTEKESVCPST